MNEMIKNAAEFMLAKVRAANELLEKMGKGEITGKPSDHPEYIEYVCAKKMLEALGFEFKLHMDYDLCKATSFEIMGKVFEV